MLSKTQIDRLGERLKFGSATESDLRSLDEYRRSFRDAYETVVSAVRNQLQLEVFGRPAKSTGAIIEKLRRESIRLTQIQDIAGCRVILPNSLSQNGVVESMKKLFPGSEIRDRRKHPSYGYRAMHITPAISGKLVEIQVRTSLQDVWAQLSEKYSDVVNPSIKYGGGPEEVRSILDTISQFVGQTEELEESIHDTRQQDTTGEFAKEIENLQAAIDNIKISISIKCDELKSWLVQQGRR